MINIAVKTLDDFAKLEKATKKAEAKALRAGGAYLRKVAANSVKRKKRKDGKASEPSDAGKPPIAWSGRGMDFKKSIVYAQEPDAVVVGPMAIAGGKLGKTHEFGGSYRIADPEGNSVLATYPARPTMGPALDKSKDRIASFWNNVIR